MLKTTLKAFNYLFYSLLICFLLDIFNILQIKYQPFKSIVYIGILCLPPILFLLIFKNIPSFKKRLITLSLPLIVFITLCYIGIMQLLFAASAWQTTEILYKHQTNPNLKIEFQQQDTGGLGYNKRTVQVQYFTPFFMRTTRLNNLDNLGPEWISVKE